MANISKEKIYLKGGQMWYKIITYSKGMFHIKLPDEMCKDLNLIADKDKEISADSEGSVNRMFDIKMKEWQAAIEINTKVIFFKAEFQGALARESFKYKWENGYQPSSKNTGTSDSEELWYFNRADIHTFSNSIGLTLEWACYNKKEVKGKFSYTFFSGRKIDSMKLPRSKEDERYKDYIEIEWTQERENFFLELDEAFARMIAKVYQGLGNLTSDKLIKLTESKIKLLSNGY